MPKKKIVHLIKTLEVGGCEIALLRMLPLTSDLFDNIIVTLQDKGSLAPQFENQGIQVISIKQNSLFDISSYLLLKKTLIAIQPDLLITHLLHADIIGRLYIQPFLACKTISSIVTTYNFKSYWLARLFERTTKMFAAGYMANSQSVKDTYVNVFGVHQEKITVIPRGIDTDSLIIKGGEQKLRSELNIQENDYVIICVANLHPNKGHTYLLTAFEKFSQNHPASKLLIVGEGEEKENLLHQVSSYQSRKNIYFLGRREDIPELLRLSDTFVLPTFFEGMSNAIMEAMTSGTPVVTTNIPENQELITHEKTGLLCPIQDSDCLHIMLEQLITNPEKAGVIGKNASQEMRHRYNLAESSKLWKNYFSSLIQTKTQ